MRSIMVLTYIALAGCSTWVDYPTFPSVDPSGIEIIDRIYSGLTPMRTVTGVACDEGYIVRRAADKAMAIDEAKDAASIGASGIANIRTKPVGSAFLCKGLSGVIVTAHAFRR